MSLPMKWWISQVGVAPPSLEVVAGALAPIPGRAHVADGCVHPDVEEVAGLVGDLEAEVGRGTRDVPVAQRLGEEGALQPVRGLPRHAALGLGPLGQKLVKGLECDEVVGGAAQLGHGTRDRAHRVLQILGAVDGSAGVAVVAVLIGRSAARALALDETIGQEDARLGVVELGDLPAHDVTAVAQGLPDLADQPLVRRAVGAAVVIEDHAEVGEVPFVGRAYFFEQRLGFAPFLLGANHRRGPVGVVGADVGHLVAAHALEAHPDVRLDVLDQVPEVDVAFTYGRAVVTMICRRVMAWRPSGTA